MQSLSSTDRCKAQKYKSLRVAKMAQTGDLKVDRWDADDQRPVRRAFRDERVVPSGSTTSRHRGLHVLIQRRCSSSAVLRRAEDTCDRHRGTVRPLGTRLSSGGEAAGSAILWTRCTSVGSVAGRILMLTPSASGALS